jgi:hypothetical protein
VGELSMKTVFTPMFSCAPRMVELLVSEAGGSLTASTLGAWTPSPLAPTVSRQVSRTWA